MAATELVKREEQEVLSPLWEPVRFMEEMEHEVERLFKEPLFSWPRLLTGFPRFSIVTPTVLTPSVDLYEKEGFLVVKAELPGLKKEEIQVELEAGYLLIKGELKAEHEVKKESYYRMERSFGKFFRRIPLPFEVQPEKIKASYTDGILEIHLPMPKVEKPAPKKVMIA